MEAIPPVTVAKEPDRRGEHEGNRKTIARGMPGDSGVTVATTCTLFAAAHRRPAFPAPSDWRVEENFSKARADCAARFIGMSRGHHCQPTGRANARPMTGSAKQSIRSLCGDMDCFVASAPRNDGPRSPQGYRIWIFNESSLRTQGPQRERNCAHRGGADSRFCTGAEAFCHF